MSTTSTKGRALIESQNLLQKFGFNGFSFQHVADALGLTKQSLYVHFKSKESLANDLIDEHRETLQRWAETIEPFEPIDKIGAWFEQMLKYCANEFKFCPMAAFAADYNSLSKSVQKNLNKTFNARKQWLTAVITEGQKRKQIRDDVEADSLAETVMAMGFGGQNMARMSNDPEQMKRRKQDALKFIKA